jgi:hypothetical protein
MCYLLCDYGNMLVVSIIKTCLILEPNQLSYSTICVSIQNRFSFNLIYMYNMGNWKSFNQSTCIPDGIHGYNIQSLIHDFGVSPHIWSKQVTRNNICNAKFDFVFRTCMGFREVQNVVCVWGRGWLLDPIHCKKLFTYTRTFFWF